jgi:hypothetical protein
MHFFGTNVGANHFAPLRTGNVFLRVCALFNFEGAR